MTPALTVVWIAFTPNFADTTLERNSFNFTGKKEYLVALEFDAKGTKAFAKATKANIGKPIYIIYDNQVISAPNVQEAITKGECTIDGMESYEAAENLASSIRIGSLPVV